MRCAPAASLCFSALSWTPPPPSLCASPPLPAPPRRVGWILKLPHACPCHLFRVSVFWPYGVLGSPLSSSTADAVQDAGHTPGQAGEDGGRGRPGVPRSILVGVAQVRVLGRQPRVLRPAGGREREKERAWGGGAGGEQRRRRAENGEGEGREGEGIRAHAGGAFATLLLTAGRPLNA